MKKRKIQNGTVIKSNIRSLNNSKFNHEFVFVKKRSFHFLQIPPELEAEFSLSPSKLMFSVSFKAISHRENFWDIFMVLKQ